MNGLLRGMMWGCLLELLALGVLGVIFYVAYWGAWMWHWAFFLAAVMVIVAITCGVR